MAVGEKAAREGVGSLFKPREGSGLANLVEAFREHLGSTGAYPVPERQPASSIYDAPQVKKFANLSGWNDQFVPFAKRMGYMTADQVLQASKWFFDLDDRLRRPPYNMTEKEVRAQMPMILNEAARTGGKGKLQLTLPPGTGQGNPVPVPNRTGGGGARAYHGKPKPLFGK